MKLGAATAVNFAIGIMIYAGIARHAVRGVRCFSSPTNPALGRGLRRLPTPPNPLSSFRVSGGASVESRCPNGSAPSTRRTTSSSSASASSSSRLLYTPFPENLYREWTLEQDRLLFSNRRKPPSELAVLLGRGIRGVERRLEKLRDVESAAYRRLFVGDDDESDDDEAAAGPDERQRVASSATATRKKKLPPFSEVLRRIEWDDRLDAADFRILHYDRVDDAVVASPLTAPNDSIDSGETSLVGALPEHRIVSLLYRERVVWDRRRNRKHDVFFGPPGIAAIQDTYDGWKSDKDARREAQRRLRSIWNDRWEELLRSGSVRDRLVRLTEDLLTAAEESGGELPRSGSRRDREDDGAVGTVPTTPTREQQNRIDAYLDTALEWFRAAAAAETADDSIGEGGGDRGGRSTLVHFLDELSEWIASPCWSCCDYDDVGASEEGNEAGLLRETLLRKLASTMDRLEGKKATAKNPSQHRKKKQHQQQEELRRILLNEDDIEETFVRGSGSGGQKINKTSNRVVLVHGPTGIRVECQETRSLQQNRKIGRKRLLEKLDAHYRGDGSKQEMKRKKLQSKKKKTKSKNRARLAAKQEAKLRKKAMQAANDEDDDDHLFV
mmetsp:Transcript_25368/g.59406  ORF Transcript_25368/g.59406 Transcript_25368/m.59406 type:complete len:612 (-) Transcript_25368:109-1944(-)